MICFASLPIDEIRTMVLTNVCACVCKYMWLHLTNDFTTCLWKINANSKPLNQFIELF